MYRWRGYGASACDLHEIGAGLLGDVRNGTGVGCRRQLKGQNWEHDLIWRLHEQNRSPPEFRLEDSGSSIFIALR